MIKVEILTIFLITLLVSIVSLFFIAICFKKILKILFLWKTQKELYSSFWYRFCFITKNRFFVVCYIIIIHACAVLFAGAFLNFAQILYYGQPDTKLIFVQCLYANILAVANVLHFITFWSFIVQCQFCPWYMLIIIYDPITNLKLSAPIFLGHPFREQIYGIIYTVALHWALLDLTPFTIWFFKRLVIFFKNKNVWVFILIIWFVCKFYI